jgi:hypothetical protein
MKFIYIYIFWGLYFTLNIINYLKLKKLQKRECLNLDKIGSIKQLKSIVAETKDEKLIKEVKVISKTYKLSIFFFFAPIIVFFIHIIISHR